MNIRPRQPSAQIILVLMRSVETVDFAECPPIKPVPDEDGSGPICEFNYCIRNCKDGFKPMHPKKV